MLRAILDVPFRRVVMDTARKQTPAPQPDELDQQRADAAVARILRDARRAPERFARDSEVPKGGE
jgi:hypothetical protein